MTLRAALKRLQDLEFEHGDMPIEIEFVVSRPEGEGDVTEVDQAVIFHVEKKDDKKTCKIMQQSYWETIANLSPKFE